MADCTRCGQTSDLCRECEDWHHAELIYDAHRTEHARRHYNGDVAVRSFAMLSEAERFGWLAALRRSRELPR